MEILLQKFFIAALSVLFSRAGCVSACVYDLNQPQKSETRILKIIKKFFE